MTEEEADQIALWENVFKRLVANVCEDCLYTGHSLVHSCIPCAECAYIRRSPNRRLVCAAHTTPPTPGSDAEPVRPIPEQLADPTHAWNLERALKQGWGNVSHIGTRQVGGTA